MSRIGASIAGAEQFLLGQFSLANKRDEPLDVTKYLTFGFNTAKAIANLRQQQTQFAEILKQIDGPKN